MSFIAMNMQMITRSWLILRVTNDSPLALTAVTLTFALPMTLVSPFAGALADRLSRRKLIAISQLLTAFFTCVLGVLDITQLVNYWHIMLIGVFNGSFMAINMPSRQALISDVVPDKSLMNAISLNNSSMNLTRVLGPAFAGLLILLIDTAGVFFIVSVIYLLSALSVTLITAQNFNKSPKNSKVLSDVKEGLRYSTEDPKLKGLFTITFIAVLFGFSYYALIPAWAREALNIKSDGLGVLLMIMGIGATIGTILLATRGDTPNKGVILLCAATAWGISLAIFAQVNTFLIAAPFLVFIGLTSSIFMSMNMSLIQLNSKKEMRGRIMSIAMMTFGLMPLSAVPFGIIAETIGTSNALSISGVLLATATVIFAIFNKSFRSL
tara:strand:- start:1675 stop:2817 length:1143 start_codon:yes stop_codon:yes gene_type:complete